VVGECRDRLNTDRAVQLSVLAYPRLERCGEAVREQHRLREVDRSHPDLELLEIGCAWLFVQLNVDAKGRGLDGDQHECWVMEQLQWCTPGARKLRRVLQRAQRAV
jgi:hypothetical protein